MYKGNGPSLIGSVSVDIMCLNPAGCWLKVGNLISLSRSLDVGRVGKQEIPVAGLVAPSPPNIRP